MKKIVLTLACLFAFVELAPVATAQYGPANPVGGWGQPHRPTVVGPRFVQPGPVFIQPAQPAAVPQPPVIHAPGTVTLPTGVNAGMLSQKVETYGFSGQAANQQGVYQALGAGELVDDSRKDTISVIHRDKATRQQLLGQIKSAMGDRVKYWEGEPEDWSLAPAGFKTDSPGGSVYMTAFDGQVLHRQDHTDVGPFLHIAAQRKADPHYDPRRDPDLTKPSGLGDLGKNLPLLILLAGVGTVIYTSTRKRPK